MYYKRYLPPVKCPLCGTLNNQVREECRFCNGPLANYCSDEDCDTLNTSDARFCKKCGRPTLFNNSGVFDKLYCDGLTSIAETTFARYGDPDSPEARKAEQRREEQARWGPVYWGDDCPEPPLDDDYIPWY